MGASALEGVTGLVGVSIPGAAEFEQEHPYLALATQFATMAVPYAGWYKTTTAIPKVARLIGAIGDLEKAPFAVGAAREAVRYAPFELGRLAASQVVGDESFPDMAGDVALSLGLSAGVGGLVHGLAAGGTRALKTSIPGVDAYAPLPLQLRKLREVAGSGTLTPEQMSLANQRIMQVEILSRAEKAPRGKYVADIGGKALTRNLNSVFNSDAKSGRVLQSKPFVVKSKPETPGFDSEEAWRLAASDAGLPENFSELGQFYRHVSFRPTGRTPAVADQITKLFGDVQAGKLSWPDYTKAVEKLASKDYAKNSAALLDRQITNGLESVGDGWFLGRESPDGMFVMAKKSRGVPKAATGLDEWVIFKTDRPSAFHPKADRWNNVVIGANSWIPGAGELVDGGLVYGIGQTFRKNFPLRDLRVAQRPSMIAAFAPKNLVGPSAVAAEKLQSATREFLTPTSHQFTKSPLAQHILQSARAMVEGADTLAHDVVFGRQKAPTKNLFVYSLRAGQADITDSVQGIVNSLDSKDLEDLRQLRNAEVPPDQYAALAAAGKITPRAAQAASALEQLNSGVWEQGSKLATAIGEVPKKPRTGHLGLSREWEGDTRIAIRDQAGVLRALAGGANRKATQANAKRLMAQIPGTRQAEEFSISQLHRASPEIQRLGTMPGFMLERDGIRGYKFDLEPWTKKDLIEAYSKNTRDRFRHQAEKSIQDQLAQDMNRLGADDPVMHRMVSARINDLLLKQSPAAKMQNQVVDSVLAPYIGSNSATRIVGVTNTSMFAFHLGMANISHPLTNLMTFFQTVTPELAFVLGAPREAASHYYSSLPVAGTKGPSGFLSVFAPLKAGFRGIREMARPQADTLQAVGRAANDGTLAPRFVEEYIGETATKVKDLKSAFSSPKDFAQWLGGVSSWLPANSEKMARTHTFVTGFRVAKDVMGLTDDAAYLFSKQLTERTMFLYSTADRPRIFTSPIGSALGLFKTWMMNYMAMMVEYSGQAVKGNIAPLAWQTGGTFAIGGLAATPLYWVANGFSRAFSGDSMLQNTYENLSEGGADALMFGLPAALTGVSLYSQVQSPFADPVHDANMLWSSVTFDRMASAVKAVGSAIDHWQATGEHPGKSPAVRDQLVRAFAPSTISRALASFSGEDTIRSLSTGYPLIDDVSLGERLLYTFKLNPTQVDRAMQASNELYNNKATRASVTSALGQAYYEAMQAGDFVETSNILRRAILLGIPPSRIGDSVKARMRLGQSALSRYKPGDVQQYEGALQP